MHYEVGDSGQALDGRRGRFCLSGRRRGTKKYPALRGTGLKSGEQEEEEEEKYGSRTLEVMTTLENLLGPSARKSDEKDT